MQNPDPIESPVRRARSSPRPPPTRSRRRCAPSSRSATAPTTCRRGARPGRPPAAARLRRQRLAAGARRASWRRCRRSRCRCCAPGWPTSTSSTRPTSRPYGAVPSTLQRSPGTIAPVYVAYPTAEQEEAIVATEPNYELAQLRARSADRRGRGALGPRRLRQPPRLPRARRRRGRGGGDRVGRPPLPEPGRDRGAGAGARRSSPPSSTSNASSSRASTPASPAPAPPSSTATRSPWRCSARPKSRGTDIFAHSGVEKIEVPVRAAIQTAAKRRRARRAISA